MLLGSRLFTRRPPPFTCCDSVVNSCTRSGTLSDCKPEVFSMHQSSTFWGSIKTGLSETRYVCGPSTIYACIHLSIACQNSITCPICLHILPGNCLAHFNLIFLHSPHTKKRKRFIEMGLCPF